MARIKTHDETMRELDEMSKDLLLLTRTVGIYPQGHPQVSQMAQRLATWARESDDPEGISVGVTNSEMMVGGKFYGGSDTKVATLAQRLHRKRVAKIAWKPELTEREVYIFARLLADPATDGESLEKLIAEREITNIQVTPLDLDALHNRMRLMDIDVTAADNERRKRLWQWLQEVAGNPKELGKALASEEFWTDAFVEDELANSEFTEMLAGLGALLDRSLGAIPEDTRAEIGEKLSKLGQTLSSDNIAKLLDVYMSECAPNGFALAALMKNVKGDRMAEILGGLVQLGSGKEERVAVFIKNFVAPDSILGLAGLFHEWKNEGEKLGYAAEIWQWLESFLLDIDENRFMGDGYRATLDRMAEKMRIFGGRAASFGFYEDPETHVDSVCAGLVLLDAENGVDVLSRRMAERIATLDTLGVISFLDMVDNTVPQVFKSRNDIFELVFRDLVGSVKDFSTQTKNHIIGLAQRHEEEATEVLLRQLAAEQRLSVRRFLVEVLAAMPRTIVPRLIQSARNAPWFFVRNIAIVFGQMCDARTIPFLRSLLENQNAKLRKEAIRNLGRIGDQSAKRVLLAYAEKQDTPGDEARMALTIAERMVEA